jgi:YVTN family beta-propeller protein
MRTKIHLPLLLILALVGCDDASDPASGQDGSENADVAQRTGLKIVATINVGGEADWMGVGFGSLWAPTPDKELLRIDPTSHKIVARIGVGEGRYRGVAIGADAVFIPNTGNITDTGGDTISKVDPTTNKVIATFKVPLNGNSEGSIGVSQDALWVVTDPGSLRPARPGVLSRIDQDTGATVATVEVPADSNGVVVEGDFVWVTSFSSDSVTQVDPATNQVKATIPVDSGPRFVTSGADAVWVMCQKSGKVTRIDAKSGQVVATIDAKSPGGGGDISFGEGAVWVTAFGKPATKIDIEKNKAVAQFIDMNRNFGDAIRAGLGSLWISGRTISQLEVP